MELEYLCGVQAGDLDKSLFELANAKRCFNQGDFYSVKPEIEEQIKIRKEKEEKASLYFKKLPFYARLIRSFPFVKGIAISGSLSKNVMHEDGDIDYFVITDRGRLWICRTFLVAFKKIFLLNSRKYFCVNYFVDEDNLRIPDENIFTAMEINYLLPVYNKALILEFREANAWSYEYVHPFDHYLDVKEVKGKSWIGRFIQFLLKGKMGDRLDLYFMKVTYKRWEKKFKHFDAATFDLTMRTNRGVSKHHPRNFQKKVLREYETRLGELRVEVEKRSEPVSVLNKQGNEDNGMS